MKTSTTRSQIKMGQGDSSQILYNVKPGQAYLVDKEDFGKKKHSKKGVKKAI